MRQQQQQVQAEVAFDRISTREELFEVLDLLCGSGKSDFTRRPEFSERPVFGAKDTLQDLEVEGLFSDAEADGAEDELSSLTDLFTGHTVRPN